MLFFRFLILTFCVTLATATHFKRFGFGVQHLKYVHQEEQEEAVVVEAAVAAATPSSPQQGTATTCANVTQYWYQDAVLDNFSPIMSQQKWFDKGQRYMANEQFWGGINYPIFVYIEGESELSCRSLTSSLYMFQLAKQHQGLLIAVEHRYYGQSMPTNDTSMKSLAYLSSTQALADLARIIGYIKTQYNTQDSKVITVGGSYAGNLAAWFRLKYPSVTYASIASSAPLTAKTNFSEYMDVVGQAMIYFSGQNCFDAFTLAAETIQGYTLQGFGSAGMTKLEQDFQTCSPITTENDLAILLSDLMGNVQGTVQYNNERKGVMNVTNICQTMTATDDAYGNFVALQKLYREYYKQSCEDASWNDTIEYLSVTGVPRCWVYQTCNEFGYFQTTDSVNQPFKSWKLLNVDLSLNMCTAAYDGWNVDPQTAWINQMYGDIQIDGSNIVFPAGTIDPWHALGVFNDTAPLPDDSELKVYIEGTAHCNDLRAPANSDPQSLTDARQIIANQVTAWLTYGAPTAMPTMQSTNGKDNDKTTLILAIVLPIGIVCIAILVGLYWVYCKSASGGSKGAGTSAMAVEINNPVNNQMHIDGTKDDGTGGKHAVPV